MADGDVLGIVAGHQQFGPLGDYATAIDLTGTLATTAQVGGPYDTRGGKSLSLFVEVMAHTGADDSLNVLVLHRVTGMPWMVAPAIEAGISGAGIPTLSNTTIWPNNGSGSGGRLPTMWVDHWAGLLDEAIIICQPRDSQAAGTGASVMTAMSAGADADLVFTVDTTAVLSGDFGNAFSVQFIDPGLPDQVLAFRSTDGYALQIVCATDGAGVITTTANDINSVLGPADAVVPIQFPISVALVGLGTGLVNATTVLPLTGGAGGATGVTYRVRGSL